MFEVSPSLALAHIGSNSLNWSKPHEMGTFTLSTSLLFLSSSAIASDVGIHSQVTLTDDPNRPTLPFGIPH
ncbi:hypothetical protein O9992_25730 [Vibrio lentus]|nr:hypothetical protein [Vibrio lentus]